jgi:hypothetical protein
MERSSTLGMAMAGAVVGTLVAGPLGTVVGAGIGGMVGASRGRVTEKSGVLATPDEEDLAARAAIQTWIRMRGEFAVRREKLDSGGYDRHGTYYGAVRGSKLWSVAGEIEGKSIDYMIRAPDWESAKDEVRAAYPSAKVR